LLPDREHDVLVIGRHHQPRHAAVIPCLRIRTGQPARPDTRATAASSLVSCRGYRDRLRTLHVAIELALLATGFYGGFADGP
jgi:hypothetical protein